MMHRVLSEEEIGLVLFQLKNDRVPRLDKVSAELLKVLKPLQTEVRQKMSSQIIEEKVWLCHYAKKRLQLWEYITGEVKLLAGEYL